MARAADGPANQQTNRSTDQCNNRQMDRLRSKNASNNYKQKYAANKKEAACCKIVKIGQAGSEDRHIKDRHIKDKLSFLFLACLTNVESFWQ